MIGRSRIIGVLGLKVLGAVFALTLSLIISRLYGVTAFGLFAVALTLSNIGALIASWGLSTSYMMDHSDNDSHGKMAAVLLVNTSLCLLCAPLLWMFATHLELGHLSSIVFAFIPFSILGAKAAALAVRGKQILNAALDDLARNLLPLLLILVFSHLFDASGDVRNLTSAYLISSTLLISLALFALKKNVPASEFGFVDAIGYLRRCGLFLLKNGSTVTLALVLILLATQADRFFLAKMVDGKQLGLYAVAQAAVNLISYVSQSVVLTITPDLVKALKCGHSGTIASISRRYSILLVAISAALLLCTKMLGHVYFSLYGIEEEMLADGINVLLVLLLGQGVGHLFGFGMTIATHEFDRKILLITQIVALSLSAALCLALIPQLGVMGAAISTSTGSVLVKIVLWICYRKRNINVGVF
ncbi:oligosaccharide flippase family protein [Variovorax sp. J2P1-59]|uniref:lipopolysaccharide biosynthesis protein n=1 Tax=Variovorax flavidus TaxID=3053501 RepID=UPI002578FC0D|nr:oligosaccharide flippase family protein [Variovorax sp. J2P1-59]MDM0073091.1 oligosaccharide flippase family protein [Variovorax sp. J2P1-59]